MCPWEQIVEEVVGEDAHFTLHAIVQQQSRRYGWLVDTSSPAPLARVDDAILHLHVLSRIRSRVQSTAGCCCTQRCIALHRIEVRVRAKRTREPRQTADSREASRESTASVGSSFSGTPRLHLTAAEEPRCIHSRVNHIKSWIRDLRVALIPST